MQNKKKRGLMQVFYLYKLKNLSEASCKEILLTKIRKDNTILSFRILSALDVTSSKENQEESFERKFSCELRRRRIAMIQATWQVAVL
jgi:hypothetical protein